MSPNIPMSPMPPVSPMSPTRHLGRSQRSRGIPPRPARSHSWETRVECHPPSPVSPPHEEGTQETWGVVPREGHCGAHLRKVLREGDTAPGGQPDTVGVTGSQAAPAWGDPGSWVPELPLHIPVPSHGLAHPWSLHTRTPPVLAHSRTPPALAYPCTPLCPRTLLHTPVLSQVPVPLHALVPSHAPSTPSSPAAGAVSGAAAQGQTHQAPSEGDVELLALWVQLQPQHPAGTPRPPAPAPPIAPIVTAPHLSTHSPTAPHGTLQLHGTRQQPTAPAWPCSTCMTPWHPSAAHGTHMAPPSTHQCPMASAWPPSIHAVPTLPVHPLVPAAYQHP